jgi:hypothetical protein
MTRNDTPRVNARATHRGIPALSKTDEGMINKTNNINNYFILP